MLFSERPEHLTFGVIPSEAFFSGAEGPASALFTSGHFTSEGAGAFRLLKSPRKIMRPSGPEFHVRGGALFEAGDWQLKSLEMFNFVRPGPREMVA